MLHHVIALGGRQELRRQHRVALFIEHAHEQVVHLDAVAAQARDRQLCQTEAIVHQCRFQVPDPDRIELPLPGVLPGTLAQERIVATRFFAQLVGVDGRGDEFFERAKHLAGRAHADRAGQLRRSVAHLKRLLADVFAELITPDKCIALAAAPEQDHQRSALEAARHVTGMHPFAHDLGELREDFLGIQNADLFAYGLELVDADIGKRVQARRGLALQPFLESLQKLCAMEEQCRRVTLQGVVDELGRLFDGFDGRCDADLDTGPVVEDEAAKFEL